MARSFYVPANGIIFFFLMAEHYSLQHPLQKVNLIYFFLSSYPGHSGFFHVLALGNGATGGAHVSSPTIVWSGCSPNVGLLGHKITASSGFSGTSTLCSTVSPVTSILSTVGEDSLF